MWECECHSFGKRTVEIKSTVPLEKEQQKLKVAFLWKRNSRKRKCRSFGKGTAETKSEKGTTDIKGVIPLKKEQ